MQDEAFRFRRNDFDVTNTVRVTDPASVAGEVVNIYFKLYPGSNARILHRAIDHVSQLYRGKLPDYAPCDTAYHDLQHILDVTLASARLIDGYERSQEKEKRLGKEMFIFGILVALFHDSGYLRKRGAEENRRGAEFTLTHVSRGAKLLENYMLETGMVAEAGIASRVIHFTGYEVPAEKIELPSPGYRTIGNLVASADILAQMSDRCYLEKCYDRLYTEFEIGGIASGQDEKGNKQVLFTSPQDLVIKTPQFYRSAKRRLDETLMGAYRYAEKHFGGKNLYLEAVEKNILFAEYVIANNVDIGLLQRTPPKTPGSDLLVSESDDRKKLVEDRRKKTGDRRKNTPSHYPALADRRVSAVDRRAATESK